jgi:pimeloyl-ACP methyl ester carboxylesterase
MANIDRRDMKVIALMVFRWWRNLVMLFVGLACLAPAFADELVKLPTRQTEEITYWWMPHSQPRATLLLFSGGSGGIGYRDGKPQSGNFLIRSRDLFFAQGFNVALVGNPTDARQMSDRWRASPEHMADVRTIIADIQKQSAAPVWVVGTSMGTISAASVGIAMSDVIKGVVLTSSITGYSIGNAVPKLALERINVPVLVYHHKDDACRVTLPHETGWIMKKLDAAPIKRLMIVAGGSNPTGPECEAMHWHGFIGMEAQAVQDIAGWVLDPQP